MRRSLAVLTLVLGLVAGMIPAGAHTLTVSDPDDTGGKLDVREVALFHDGSGDNLKYIWIIRTYNRWRKAHVSGSQGLIVIQIKRSPESSWRIEISKHGNGKIMADLIMCTEGGGCNYNDVETYGTKRPNKKSVRVKIPADALTAVGDKVKFRVFTTFGTGCGAPCHIDLTPNSGMESHTLN